MFWALIVLVGAVCLSYFLSLFSGVNFENIDYYSINNTLPDPLFNRQISSKYITHLKSISIYDSKEKGKSTFGELLALQRYKEHKPVIYASLERNPCIELGIAAGIYSKSFHKPISYILSLIRYPSTFNTNKCDLADILKQIGDAAKEQDSIPFVIIDPLERFNKDQIKQICFAGRKYKNIVKFIAISTSTSQTSLQHSSDCASFVPFYFGDISKNDTLSYLKKQCKFNDYDSCISYEIIGGHLGDLHEVCIHKDIDQLIKHFWLTTEQKLVENKALKPIIKKILDGDGETEFDDKETEIIMMNDVFIVYNLNMKKYRITKKILIHLINDVWTNIPFQNVYNEIKKKCKNESLKEQNDHQDL